MRASRDEPLGQPSAWPDCTNRITTEACARINGKYSGADHLAADRHSYICVARDHAPEKKHRRNSAMPIKISSQRVGNGKRVRDCEDAKAAGAASSSPPVSTRGASRYRNGTAVWQRDSDPSDAVASGSL